MLFNSLEFIIFLPIVYLLYWFVFNKNLKWQNSLLLVASYVFYGWWDWRFLFLILISTFVDYFIALSLDKTDDEKRRKYLKYLSIAVNIGILGTFKYFNFFIDSFADLLNVFNLHVSLPALKIILPVGISFYTFQTLGYTLDVFKKKFKAEKELLNFMVYVCFFPQLVAGPIERARNLMPQFKQVRRFSRAEASDGLRLILIGLFKKVVLADNLAQAVDYIFANYTEVNPLILFLGGNLFLVQIYFDFAGYSDIAIGTAKLFGFKLMKNFDFPFYTANGQQFWNRWHISLTYWFRDYLLLSLKSSFKNRFRFGVNFVLTLSLIGFWHGANWTFIMFGFVSGLYVMPAFIWRKQFKKMVIPRDSFPTLKNFSIMIFLFTLYAIPAIFFRSPNLTNTIDYFKYMFINFKKDYLLAIPEIVADNIHWFIVPLILEWFLRNREHSLDIIHLKKPIRWAIYILLILILISYGEFHYKQFIYFQF